MKIVCPMNPAMQDYIDDLAARGADEFFLGHMNRLRHAGEVMSRRKGAHQNFPSLSSLKGVIRRIHDAGRQVHVAINEHFYPLQYQEAILHDAQAALALGVDGFIISDINLIIQIAEFKPRPLMIASTGAHIMNSEAVDFFRALGVRRVILPRHLTPQEIRGLVLANQDMAFEIFVKNEDCPNIDGFCSYMHGTIDNCAFDLACGRLEIGDDMQRRQGPDTHACGTCSLHALRDLQGLYLKIVGRHQLIDMTRKDVSYIRTCLDHLAACDTAEAYAARCRETHLDIYNRPCRERCYR